MSSASDSEDSFLSANEEDCDGWIKYSPHQNSLELNKETAISVVKKSSHETDIDTAQKPDKTALKEFDPEDFPGICDEKTACDKKEKCNNKSDSVKSKVEKSKEPENIILTQDSSKIDQISKENEISSSTEELKVFKNISSQSKIELDKIATFKTENKSDSVKQKIKKPREKLGERMQVKKLGSKTNTILPGISCDSINLKEQSNECAEFFSEKIIDAEQHEISKNLSEGDENLNWGSWGDWGSALSSISSAASNITMEVEKSVEAVFQNVGNSLGAPDPSILAEEISKTEKVENIEKDKSDLYHDNSKIEPKDSTWSFGSIGSGVLGAFETATNTVLLGGLDTLEKIGRKTMDIIQDGDPGLRRKRNFLKFNKSDLSTVLKEARERAINMESEGRECEISDISPSNISMLKIWDETEGPAHSEALSLVAKQCREKTLGMKSNLSPVLQMRLQSIIEKIAECRAPEQLTCDDIEVAIIKITQEIQIPINFTKIHTGWPTLRNFLNKLSIEIQAGLGEPDQMIIQRDLYREVSKFVSQVVAVCHKGAEVCLVQSNVDPQKLAIQFKKFCSLISTGLEQSADSICESLSLTLSNAQPITDDAITNIYIQISELNSYLETSLANLNSVFIFTATKLALDL